MNNSKKLLLALFFLGLLSQTFDAAAQDREIGVKLRSLDNFDLVYKTKKADDKFMRYEFGFLSTSLVGTSGSTNFSSVIGFSGGIEKRKPINEKLQFAHGFLPGIYLDGFYTKNKVSGNEDFDIRIRPQLAYVLGVQYHVSENFYFGLEATPSIAAAFGFNENQTLQYSFTTNIDFNTVGITAVYRFSKTK
ncbi:MAG: hypothetical protein HC803_04780 [Saprospiraceae bacterium]|nr:hypothetical protein [Saprospiraceae bacterium]